MVATRRDGGYGGRDHIVQGVEESPLVTVTVAFCDDENDGRDHAPIPRQTHAQDRKRFQTVTGN